MPGRPRRATANYKPGAMALQWPTDRAMDGPQTHKFVTIGNPTLTQVPGIAPKAHENLKGKRGRPGQAHRSGARLYPGRIHLPIDRVGISPVNIINQPNPTLAQVPSIGPKARK